MLYHTKTDLQVIPSGQIAVTISLHNVQFSYDKTSGEPILNIPEWTVAKGEQVFLHGPSGSGKTTLLNLLAGIMLPDAGSIEILGKPLNTLSCRQRDQWRARHIGVVFQQFNLIPYLDAVNNIKLAAHFGNTSNAGPRAQALLTALGIAGPLQRQPAAQLSIGQQQRVAIARALINQPELFIVDEPTSALDKQNRDAFMSLLFEQVCTNGTTLLFVSHDLNLADKFSRVEALTDINRAGATH